MSTIKDISDSRFETDVLQADKPVLVDFWAPWCGPCKMMHPILKEIAADYGDKLTIAKINIDDNPETPEKFAVRGIPTLLLFKNGEVSGKSVGAVNKAKLTAFLDSHL